MNSNAEKIKQMVKMRDAFNRCGIDVNRAGFSNCPFHQGDRTASLKMYEDSFYCFGCGTSGDVITLYSKIFGIGFGDAIRKINDDFSLGLSIGRKKTLSESRADDRKFRDYVERINRRKEKEEEYRNEYDRLINAWIDCDIAKRYADPESDIYAIACKRISIIGHQLDCAEGGEYDFNHGN